MLFNIVTYKTHKLLYCYTETASLKSLQTYCTVHININDINIECTPKSTWNWAIKHTFFPKNLNILTQLQTHQNLIQYQTETKLPVGTEWRRKTYINNRWHAAVVDRLWAVWPHVRTFSEVDVSGMQCDRWLVWPQCLERSDQVQLALTLLKHVDVGKSTSGHEQSLLHCGRVHTTSTTWHHAAICTTNQLSITRRIHRPGAGILCSHPPNY